MQGQTVLTGSLKRAALQLVQAVAEVEQVLHL